MKTIFVKSQQRQLINEPGDLKIVLEEGAYAEHYLFAPATIVVEQKKDSRYKVVTMGSATITDSLLEEGAEAELFGLTLAGNEHERQNRIHVSHLAPHTTSRQLYKSIVWQHGRSQFEGKISIEKGGQKSIASQVNKNLVLSKDARAESKPELKIDTDDVKVSHGSATGHLDTDALFYLQTRGLNKDDARHLLLKGFCQEILDEINDPALLATALNRVAEAIEHTTV